MYVIFSEGITIKQDPDTRKMKESKIVVQETIQRIKIFVPEEMTNQPRRVYQEMKRKDMLKMMMLKV